MARRLFVFAIGGTGSRVLKSLTMMLASGVKPNTSEEYEIIPIIIDPHVTNDDLTRTKNLIENYQKIKASIDSDSAFFGTKITTLSQMVSSENRLADSFLFDLQDVSDTRFKDYLGYQQLDTSNKALVDLLFSGKSIDKRGMEVPLLDVEMDIGFIGNPNIGSVVLNQFKDSQEFKEFASNLNDEDRIFIISSIFGGTGAAGFPIVLKNIRNALNNQGIDGRGFLQNAKIGAISVLPYFNVEKSSESPIQKSDFFAKSRAALYYYKENVAGNSSVNALYYIADDYNGKAYKNDPGEGGQQNDAHFIELASALSIIDYLEIPDNELKTIQGKAQNPVYKEFGIKNSSTTISFNDLEDITETKLALPLSQLLLLKKYMDEQLHHSIGKNPWNTDAPSIDKSFTDEYFYRSYLTDFLDSYLEWLQEMSSNRRSFAPFNFNGDVKSFIKDRSPSGSGVFSYKKFSYTTIENELNELTFKNNYSSAENKFITLFYSMTQNILTKKFGL